LAAYLTAAGLLALCLGILVVHLRTRAELRGVRERFAPVLDVEAEIARLRQANDAAASKVAAARSRVEEERERLVLEIAAGRAQLEKEREQVEAEISATRQQSEQARQQASTEIQAQRSKWEQNFTAAVTELETLSKQVDHVRDQVEMQSFGLYEPVYDFD